MTDYTVVESLSGVYLEDSYVLAIEETPQEISFRGEWVLTERHPAYRPPAPGEQYCYANGYLVIPTITRVEWVHRSTRHFTDANDEQDLGNIDYLTHHTDHWHTGGDWGEFRAYTTTNPYLRLTDS